jgi:exocyst complex component 1
LNRQIIGIIASLERFLVDADERGSTFLVNLLEKQQTRLKGLFNNHVVRNIRFLCVLYVFNASIFQNEQLKQIEQTKVTSKKRNGVAPFILTFSTYISRVEVQLVGASTLPIRANVDEAYDKLVSKMFDSLRQMAKMNGEDEDKGQLNYHVILIGEIVHLFFNLHLLNLYFRKHAPLCRGNGCCPTWFCCLIQQTRGSTL